MNDTQETRLSLLARIQATQDSNAWCQLVDIYSPMVYRFVRRKGFQDADVADVAQDVFRTVARAIKRFECDHARGSFRGWLMSIVRSRLQDYVVSSQRQVHGSGDTRVVHLLEEQPSKNGEEALWEADYRKSVFEWAVRQVRGDFQDSTWNAFWLTAVEGKEIHQVAETLDMTIAAIYVARCRVLARLKEKVRQVDA